MKAVHYKPEQLNERFEFSGKFKRNVIYLLIIGVVFLVTGILLTQNAPVPAHAVAEHGGHAAHQVTWYTHFVANFLLANTFYFRIGMGAMVFLMFTWLVLQIFEFQYSIIVIIVNECSFVFHF